MSNRVRTFFQNKLVTPLLGQLRQGVTPEKLALSCALGVGLALFPVLGSTTLLCFVVAYYFKLNQPAIQSVNYMMFPAQILMIPVLVRLGEILYGSPHLTLNPKLLVSEFFNDPSQFLKQYGIAGLHGMTAWIFVAPWITAATYFILKPILSRFGQRLNQHLKRRVV